MSHSDLLGWDPTFCSPPEGEGPDNTPENIESLCKEALESYTDDTIYELAFEHLEKKYRSNLAEFEEDWQLFMEKK